MVPFPGAALIGRLCLSSFRGRAVQLSVPGTLRSLGRFVYLGGTARPHRLRKNSDPHGVWEGHEFTGCGNTHEFVDHHGRAALQGRVSPPKSMRALAPVFFSAAKSTSPTMNRKERKGREEKPKDERDVADGPAESSRAIASCRMSAEAGFDPCNLGRY